MKIKLLLSILCITVVFCAFGQTDSIQINKETVKIDSVKAENAKHGNLLAYLYELQQISGEDNIEHSDSISGYSLIIPKWWKIRETPNTSLFGGTFPAIGNIQNALIFKAFDKSNYKTIKDFENWVIGDYKLGDTPKWSGAHKVLLKEELNDFKKIGKSYKVQLMWNGKLYHCCYVIIETSSSYLWIDFTATQETYKINYPKLKKIMADYKTL